MSLELTHTAHTKRLAWETSGRDQFPVVFTPSYLSQGQSSMVFGWPIFLFGRKG